MGVVWRKQQTKRRRLIQLSQECLKKLEKQLPGFKYTIFNFFKVFADSIHNPTKYGIFYLFIKYFHIHSNSVAKSPLTDDAMFITK